MIWNPTSVFLVPGSTFAALFIFDTEDGTISLGISTSTQRNAVLAVDNSASGAVYKGLAFGTNINGNHIYATNFHAGTFASLPPGNATSDLDPARFGDQFRNFDRVAFRDGCHSVAHLKAALEIRGGFRGRFLTHDRPTRPDIGLERSGLHQHDR